MSNISIEEEGIELIEEENIESFEEIEDNIESVEDEAIEGDEDEAKLSESEIEEVEYLVSDMDEGVLPTMSHQSLRNATATGFGEIFNKTTKPIYSIMNLHSLASTAGAGGEMPPVISTRNSIEGNKVLEFERIYGKMTKQKRGQRDKDKQQEEFSAAAKAANMESNFLKTIVKTCLFRLVLVGTHKEDQEKMIDWTKDVVDNINAHCYSETITGCLLIYPNHFVHVLEASEDTIMKYMKVIADQFEPTGYDWKLQYNPSNGATVRAPILFTTVKTSVIGMFQIQNRRIVNGWKAERAGSGLTMTKSEVPKGDYRERLFQFAKQCIIMALAICKLTPLRSGESRMSASSLAAAVVKSSIKGIAFSNTLLPGLAASILNTKELDEANQRFEDQKRRRAASISKIVPKPAFIDYIVKKNPKRKIQLRSVREHINYFWKIPTVIFSQETEWPIPGKIAPYD